jgi:predicted DNA-binding ribbon-helix-helix protein
VRSGHTVSTNQARRQKSLIVPRTIKAGKHKLGISVEGAFWTALKEIAAAEGTSVTRLVTNIERERHHANRSSVVRLFILDYYSSRRGNNRPQASDAPEAPSPHQPVEKGGVITGNHRMAIEDH